jgi:hypothetical protein
MKNNLMDKETEQLIQSLVNALSRGLRYTSQATKESYRADAVYEESMAALNKAQELGFENNVKEDESHPFGLGNL